MPEVPGVSPLPVLGRISAPAPEVVPEVDEPVTRPEVETPAREDTSFKTDLLRPWNVLLHNDDHNEMLYVVRSLRKAVPTLNRKRAAEIMLEAHQFGVAVVISCPLELAELYRDRLQTFGLTASIELA